MFPIAEIDDATLAVPANVLGLMPAYEKCREAARGKWAPLASTMFFAGLKTLKLKPREGVDEMKALRHIRAILESFEPKHEHKIAAVAYLFDQWFEDAEWEAEDVDLLKKA